MRMIILTVYKSTSHGDTGQIYSWQIYNSYYKHCKARPAEKAHEPEQMCKARMMEVKQSIVCWENKNVFIDSN
jgi:hypothetical protein